MSVHQCPKCELRFSWRTELDDHCRHDHPDFEHKYHDWHADDTGQQARAQAAGGAAAGSA